MSTLLVKLTQAIAKIGIKYCDFCFQERKTIVISSFHFSWFGHDELLNPVKTKKSFSKLVDFL